MRAEIWMGGKPVYIYQVKKVDTSIDGTFVKITSVLGDVIEVSPTNVIFVHDKEKGGAGNG
jgi:hypothetical protein